MPTAPGLPAYSAWASVAYPIALAFLAIVQYWILKKTNEVHKLVNSQSGITLEALAVALEANAAITNKPEAIAAAQVARKNTEDHKKAQAAIDTKGLL
jgi:hypothetical protein